MNQKIKDFHKDSENHWVADLECGHAQHVRHDPPWTLREWVTTEAGRSEHIGQVLNCVRCEEVGENVAKAMLSECRKILNSSYEEAGISGLCDEGRFEAAVGALESLDLKKIIEKALKTK